MRLAQQAIDLIVNSEQVLPQLPHKYLPEPVTSQSDYIGDRADCLPAVPNWLAMYSPEHPGTDISGNYVFATRVLHALSTRA